MIEVLSSVSDPWLCVTAHAEEHLPGSEPDVGKRGGQGRSKHMEERGSCPPGNYPLPNYADATV